MVSNYDGQRRCIWLVVFSLSAMQSAYVSFAGFPPGKKSADENSPAGFSDGLYAVRQYHGLGRYLGTILSADSPDTAFLSLAYPSDSDWFAVRLCLEAWDKKNRKRFFLCDAAVRHRMSDSGFFECLATGERGDEHVLY